VRRLPVDLLVAGGLFVVQAALIAPLFAGDFTRARGSIESAYITDARFIAEHFPDLSWNPLWYLGFPFEWFYTPLLPAVVAALGKITGDVPEMYRIVAATGYALGPPALYLATRQIARLPLAGAFAALAFIFLPSPAYLLPALRNDASSFFTDLVLPPNQRLFVLVKYGEGPHVLSLSLALLALAATARYVRSPSAPRLALAVLPLVGAALTNLIGVLGAILFIGFLPASAPLGDTALGRWARVLRVGVLAGLFSLGWYSLGFIRAVFGFTTPGGAEGGSAYVFFPILVGIGLLLVAQLSRRVPEGLELAIGWSVVFAVIVAALQLGGAALVPQPTRFALELDVAFAVAFGVALAALVRWLAGILEPRAVGALALAFCAAVIVLGAGTWTAIRDDLEPDPHWTEWSERATALWLAAHLAPGERAYLSGDHAFWLDVFADVPQVRGGVDFAFSNPWWAHVAYQMNTGADADVSTLWMEALPVRYVVVAGPGSPEIYKEDWVYPRKFDGRLALALDQRGVRIYEVPRAGDARLVVARVGDLAAPTSAVDRPALETYVARMRVARAPARLEQRGLGGWRADVEVADGESVVLRQAYDTGWHATVDGRDVAVRADPIGQLLVPVPAGAHVVELDHRLHGDLLAGIGVATLTALGLLGSGVRGRLRHAAA
jgi:hypothetical protein